MDNVFLTLTLNIVWNSSLISYCLTSPSLTLLFLRCLPDNLLCLFCVVLVDFVLAFQSGFPLHDYNFTFFYFAFNHYLLGLATQSGGSKTESLSLF